MKGKNMKMYEGNKVEERLKKMKRLCCVRKM